MTDCKDNMLLYAVTDRAWTDRYDFFTQVKMALEGGVTCVQLREKNMSEEEFLAEAIKMSELCRIYGVPLIINDNVDIAIRSGADGVHVGQSDMPPSEVRKLIGDEMILGVTAKTVEQALSAQAQGADYLGVGAAFSTSTKTDTSVISHSVYGEITAAVNIPVVAIGGITADNILTLSGCGLSGAALVSAIFSADDITERCRLLIPLCRKISGREI